MAYSQGGSPVSKKLKCKIFNTFLSKIVSIVRAFPAAVLMVFCSLLLSPSGNDNKNNNNNNNNNYNYFYYKILSKIPVRQRAVVNHSVTVYGWLKAVREG